MVDLARTFGDGLSSAAPTEPCGLSPAGFNPSPGPFRHSPAYLAAVARFEATVAHACDIEAKARMALDAFRETDRKWESRRARP